MSELKKKALFIVCLPWNMIVWSAWLAMAKLWGHNLHWEDTVLVFEFRHDSWPMRTWYKGWGGSAMGHAVLYKHNPSERTHTHEMVHVEQYEASMIKSFFGGLFLLCIGHPFYGLMIWTSGYLIMGVGNYIHSWMKGHTGMRAMYRNTMHERHAYAEDKVKHGLK